MRAGNQRLQLIWTPRLPEECLDAPLHESVGVEQQQIHQLAGGIRSSISPSSDSFQLEVGSRRYCSKSSWDQWPQCPPARMVNGQRQIVWNSAFPSTPRGRTPHEPPCVARSLLQANKPPCVNQCNRAATEYQIMAQPVPNLQWRQQSAMRVVGAAPPTTEPLTCISRSPKAPSRWGTDGVSATHKEPTVTLQ